MMELMKELILRIMLQISHNNLTQSPILTILNKLYLIKKFNKLVNLLFQYINYLIILNKNANICKDFNRKNFNY